MQRKNLHVVEIFPPFSDIHHVKDPGLLLTYLHKEGATCTLITKRKSLRATEDFTIYAKRLFFLSTSWHLLRHGRNIDVLLLFHTHPLNPIYSMVYKLRNPKGNTYVKADMDNTILNLHELTLINIVRRLKIWLNLWCADMMTVEQQKIITLLKNRYPRFRKKVSYLPNGYKPTPYTQKPFAKKRNHIVCVGPVGSHQKATEDILETFSRLKADKWKLVMAGKVLDDFKPYLDTYFKRNPQLRKRVILLGFVKDHKKMFNIYNTGKIFFMPSRFEGFSIAIGEAAACGNVIVGTPVGGISEFTNQGKIGAICDPHDIKGFVREIQKRIDNPALLEHESIATRKHAEKYRWDRIVRTLYAKL